MFNPVASFRRYAAKHGYATAPIKSDRMPPGVPYIVGNEGAERFSYYGMRAILVVFMTQYMMTRTGQPDHLNEMQAKVWFHNFVSAVYFLPLLGAIVADAFFGKYRTIIWLSLVYCAGHLALALDDTRHGLMLGLTLIAFGAGGIKPCVSANVGDQFGQSNAHLLPRVFNWFYLAINSGSTIATVLIPFILDKYGPHYAFGIPGILMFVATVIFWMGRKKFVHIPPGGNQFLDETFSRETWLVIRRLAVLYIFIAVFWALFDQTSSSWVFQAQHMNRHILGWELLPSQFQVINPAMVVLFIPIFTLWIYPTINKFYTLTALRKIGIGFFLAVPSFLIPAWVETRIAHGEHPSIGWQVLSYAFITAAEIHISITGLEFSYTQAPKRMKSLIMGIFLCSTTVGDLFVSFVNIFIQNPDGSSKLPGEKYYLFFAGLMFICAIIYACVSPFFKVHTVVQDEAPKPPAVPASAS
jgi:proton-dependent oligopeptide transporter, POT family